MKKITIFHQEFYFSGGAEKLIFEEMDSLKEKGYEVECWAPLVDRKHCFPQRINNYKIYGFLPNISLIPREAIILLSLLFAPFFAWSFKNVDIFYGENQAGPYFAFLMAKIWKKPYIIFMPYPVGLLYPRDIDQEAGLLVEVPVFISSFMKLFIPLVRYIDKEIIKNADAVLTTGEYAKSIFEKIYHREIINAPSGANNIPRNEIEQVNRWKGSIKIDRNDINKPYIILTNRTMPKKKFEYIIESLPVIRKKIAKVTVIIAGGKNKYTQSLIERAKKLKVEKYVHFVGFLDGNELAISYKHAAVYVYTAPEEDYGKGMVEAMANAIPVVAWNFAGPTGIVKNRKSGFLANPFDVRDLAQKITELLMDREKNEQMGWYGWELVKEKFAPEKHDKVLRGAIEKALRGRNHK